MSSSAQNAGNQMLAARWFECVAARDTVALASFYADTARIESPNWESEKRGPAAIHEMYSRYFTSSPDLVHHATSIFTNEHAIVVEYTFAGTMANPEKSAPAYMKGKKYVLKACSRMDVWNGKITAQSFYFDQAAFLRQVGFFEQH
ncbi:MAG TPA: nuclear transport factor 2 family protein, partial [Puia sp.]|nr:nuclear transport factor 2 family protein [Puia sp.]